MLTATYALVTLSVEQKKSRGTLAGLHQELQSCVRSPETALHSSIERILDQLVQFDEGCHWRNLELYVIPALRSAAAEGAALIAELESLSAAGEKNLGLVRYHLRQAYQQGSVGVLEMAAAMDRYCQSLMQRLTREESELLPLAEHVISSEEWFEIAAQFISHEAESQTRRQARPQPIAQGAMPTFATRVARLYQLS
jgi:hemerythrin-like domain-containing protein